MITALQEVRKLWSLERGTGYIVGKVSDFNVTDTDIRSLYGTRWVTDQVCIPVLQSKSLTFSGHIFFGTTPLILLFLQVVDAYLANIVQRELEKGKSVSLYPSQTMKRLVEGTFSVDKCRQKVCVFTILLYKHVLIFLRTQ